MSERIYLSSPHLSAEGYELEYVRQAFESNWITSMGENIDGFENDIKKYVNIDNAVALSSGTAA